MPTLETENLTGYQNPDATFGQRYYEAIRRVGFLSAAGRVALRGFHHEELTGLERRQYDEMTSGLAEALKGIVRTHYEFELRNGRLVAADGEVIHSMLLRAHGNTYKLGDSDSFYHQDSFLLRRSANELRELECQEAMARGETDFNTLITFSPYSEEYKNDPDWITKLQKAAQRPELERAMLRVSHWDGAKMHIMTRSIDNSSVGLLQETARRALQYEFKAKDSTGILGEPIAWNIDDGSWSTLPDSITRTADQVLAEQKGGTWTQGRPTGEDENLQTYVESQSQIVETLLNKGRLLTLRYENHEGWKQAFDKEAYKYAKLLELRLKNDVSAPIVNIQAAANAAGAIAEAQGQSFVMCGMMLTPTSSEAALATATGFESLMRLAGQLIKCPACKKKVVAPTDKLEKGILECKACEYEIEGCTGKVYHESNVKHEDLKQPDGFAILAAELEQHAEQSRLKRQQEKMRQEQKATES